MCDTQTLSGQIDVLWLDDSMAWFNFIGSKVGHGIE